MKNSAWAIFLCFLIAFSFCIHNLIQGDFEFLSIGVIFFLLLNFINLNSLEFKSTTHSIIIKKRHPFVGKRKNRIVLKIPKSFLKSYHIHEKLFGYELILVIKNEKEFEKYFRIYFLGFNWKLMIKMIKSLEYAKRQNQYAD